MMLSLRNLRVKYFLKSILHATRHRQVVQDLPRNPSLAVSPLGTSVPWCKHNSSTLLNPFFPNSPFLPAPLKISDNRKGFRCFQGVKKGCVGNEWVNIRMILATLKWLNRKVNKKECQQILSELINFRIHQKTIEFSHALEIIVVLAGFKDSKIQLLKAETLCFCIYFSMILLSNFFRGHAFIMSTWKGVGGLVIGHVCGFYCF